MQIRQETKNLIKNKCIFINEVLSKHNVLIKPYVLFYLIIKALMSCHLIIISVPKRSP